MSAAKSSSVTSQKSPVATSNSTDGLNGGRLRRPLDFSKWSAQCARDSISPQGCERGQAAVNIVLRVVLDGVTQRLIVVVLGLLAAILQKLEQLPPRGDCLEIEYQAIKGRIHALPPAGIPREKARRYGEAQP